jgi:hypothetical protein
MTKMKQNIDDQKKEESILTFVHGNQTLDDLLLLSLLLLLPLRVLDLLVCCCDLLLALHRRRRPLELDLTPFVIHDRHAMPTLLITGVVFVFDTSVIVRMMVDGHPISCRCRIAPRLTATTAASARSSLNRRESRIIPTMAIVPIGRGSLAGLLSPFLDQKVGHGVGMAGRQR